MSKDIKAYNNTVTRDLLKIEKKNIDKETLKSYHDFEYGENTIVKFDDSMIFKNIKLDAVSSRFLLLILEKFTSQIKKNETDLNVLREDGAVTITLNEYMNEFNLKDRKSAKKQIKSILNTFANMRVTFKDLIVYEEKKDRNKRTYYKKSNTTLSGFVNIFDSVIINNTNNHFCITVNFGTSILKKLPSSNILHLPREIYSLDVKRYSLSQKLLLEMYYLQSQHTKHDTINMYDLINKLYSFTNASGIKDAHFKRDVIDIIVKNMKYLKDTKTISDYCFTQKKSNKHFDFDINSVTSYKDLDNVYLNFAI